MRSLSIDEAISALEGLGQKIADTAEKIMLEEAPVRTGGLARSIRQERMDESTWWIGTDIFYADYVEHGRGVVRPVRAKVLHWYDGVDVFTMRAGPSKPNPFAERTANRLKGMSFTL